MRLLTAGQLAGAAENLDTFMGDLTLDQLRGTATMGFILVQPGLRRRYDANFEVWLPIIGEVTEEYVARRRAGESPLAISVDYTEVLIGLNEGARFMRPSFPRRDTLTDSNLVTLCEIQSAVLA